MFEHIGDIDYFLSFYTAFEGGNYYQLTGTGSNYLPVHVWCFL
jgi:hypothetical protein